MMQKEKKKWQIPEVYCLVTGDALMLTESLEQGHSVPGSPTLESRGSLFHNETELLTDEEMEDE